MDPEVAVVMPVRNGARTVARAIDSVITQTYQHWRLYVVVDQSTDNTLAIVQRYAHSDARIVLIENTERRGLAYALNVGWRTSTESLIARADADDINQPERLERQVAYLQSHPEIAVLGTGVTLIGDDGTIQGVHQRPARHEELVQRVFRECPFMHPSVMMRRSFLEALGGYTETLRVAEDYDLWLRGAPLYQYANLPDFLVCYTVSTKSASTRWAHTVGAAQVILRHATAYQRRSEGIYYSARFVLAGVLTRVGVRRRRL